VTSDTPAALARTAERPRPALSMSTGRAGDRIFAGLSRGSGLIILAIMAAISVFLVWKAIPALQDDKANFLTSQEWNPDGAPAKFGIAQLVFGTLMTSFLALVMAVPVAVGIALFITYYAPRQVKGVMAYLVDLLAAVPSIVYGLWGLNFLVTKMTGVSEFLNAYFGWIPLFGGDETGGRTILTASVVLAIMILPIISAITREVFVQVPHAHVEAALALGETIAVAMVLSTTAGIDWHILKDGGNTFAANIANTFAMSGPTGRSALIASGLVLFVITLIVNVGARAVVARRKEFS
jgi:phosphate transport system permease protein